MRRRALGLGDGVLLCRTRLWRKGSRVVSGGKKMGAVNEVACLRPLLAQPQSSVHCRSISPLNCLSPSLKHRARQVGRRWKDDIEDI